MGLVVSLFEFEVIAPWSTIRRLALTRRVENDLTGVGVKHLDLSRVVSSTLSLVRKPEIDCDRGFLVVVDPAVRSAVEGIERRVWILLVVPFFFAVCVLRIQGNKVEGILSAVPYHFHSVRSSAVAMQFETVGDSTGLVLLIGSEETAAAGHASEVQTIRDNARHA